MFDNSHDGQTKNKRRPLHKRVWRLCKRVLRFLRYLRFAINYPRIRRTLVLHESKYTERIAPQILIPMLCWSNKGRFRKPDNLAILLLHNRDYKTIAEQSLDYLGIAGYSVVHPHLPRGVWRHSVKIIAGLDFARNCAEEYILYVDSDDAILIGDPERAIGLLHDSGGEMLFSTTTYTDYELMPDLEDWFRQMARDAGWTHAKNVNLNSGVFVARREVLIELLEAAAEYVTDNDLSLKEFEMKRDARAMPGYPLGCGCDQNIFRFVSPRFSQNLRLDYAAKLAIR